MFFVILAIYAVSFIALLALGAPIWIGYVGGMAFTVLVLKVTDWIGDWLQYHSRWG